jgi:hypothetical protein
VRPNRSFQLTNNVHRFHQLRACRPRDSRGSTAQALFAAELSVRWAALIAFVGWPLVGTALTIDEDLPGGWSNPDGKTRPGWLTPRSWAPVAVGFSVASFIAAADSGLGSNSFIVLVGLGVVFGVVALVLARHSRHDANPAI